MTLETFPFHETVQVFSNPIPNLNPKSYTATTSRAKTNHYWLNLPYPLNYTTPLFEGLRTSFPPYQKIWSSPHFRIPLINSRNKKDRTLDSPSIIVSFSNTEGDKLIYWVGRATTCG